MKFLITGGFGNVGHAIIHELLKKKHNVRVFELKNSKTLKQAKNMVKKSKFSGKIY